MQVPYCRVLKPTLNRSRSRIEADVFDVVSGTVASLEYKPRLVNGYACFVLFFVLRYLLLLFCASFHCCCCCVL